MKESLEANFGRAKVVGLITFVCVAQTGYCADSAKAAPRLTLSFRSWTSMKPLRALLYGAMLGYCIGLGCVIKEFPLVILWAGGMLAVKAWELHKSGSRPPAP